MSRPSSAGRRQAPAVADPNDKKRASIEENNDAVAQFFTWAVGRWAMLREIFKLYDQTSKYCTFRTVSAREFVEFLWWHGFEGNALQVFQEISLETPGPGHGAAGQKGHHGEICLAQLHRFEKRNMDITKGVESPVVRFTRTLRKSRGCLLRAWRLDLDHRGSGLVAHADFVAACRRLGFGGETKVLWNSFRPGSSGTNCAPLEFREFDRAEADNLEQFADALWTSAEFDLTRAWTCIDPLHRGVVTFDEFAEGAQMLGFEGNVRLLFKGLDSTGLGKLRRQELDYLQVLSLSSSRVQYCMPAIRSFNKFVQVELGGPNALLIKLGLTDSAMSMGVDDFAQSVMLLGYRGDAKRIATVIARLGGERINGELLYSVLSDVGAGHVSSPEATTFQSPPSTPPTRASSKPSSPTGGQQQWRPNWRGSLDDVAARNIEFGQRQRKYFSTPAGGPATLLQPDHVNRRPALGTARAGSLRGASSEWAQSMRSPRQSPRPYTTLSEVSSSEFDDQRMLVFKKHRETNSTLDLIKAAHYGSGAPMGADWEEASTTTAASVRPAQRNVQVRMRERALGHLSGQTARQLRATMGSPVSTAPSSARTGGGRRWDGVQSGGYPQPPVSTPDGGYVDF